MTSARPPNLVFVYADQMRGSAMGFLGEEPISTPNLDAFAGASLVLDQAASNYPVCVPYRTILMTGKYAVSNGVRVNCFCDGRDLPGHHVWWTDILDRHGWFCGYLGKWHITKPTESHGHWLPPGRRHGIRTWMLQTSNQHMAMQYVCHDRGPTELLEADRWSVEWETDRALEFLENRAGTERDPDKPFALTISWNPPHDPLQQVPQRYLDAVDVDTEAHCAQIANLPAAGTEMGDRYRSRIRPYYAAVMGIDDQFGRILSCLERNGLADNTIVVFTADHGDQVGRHGCRDPKNMPWEEAMRIPFLIRWPGHIAPGRDDLLLSTADLYPTILDLLGLGDDIAADLEGISYAPLLLGREQARPTSQLYMHIREPEGDPAWGRRGVRTHRYTLSINKAPDEPTSCVLYDNLADPYQTTNIAAENRQVVQRLIDDELKPWLRRTNDPFDIPPLDTFLDAPWSELSPGDISRLRRKESTHMRRGTAVLGAVCMLASLALSHGAEFYVSPLGSDTNAGTVGKPFRTLARARDAVRESGKLGKEPVTVQLRGGTHYLPEAVVFRAADSGTAEAPVTYAAYQDEEAVLSGGTKLDLTWEEYRDGILVAQTPAGLAIDQLFVNGKRQLMARYPNYSEDAPAYNGCAADAFAPSRAANWQNPAGGYIHAMHSHRWGGYHYRITGKDADHNVTYEGGWQNNRQMGMHKSLRMVENVFEELDAPREWYHDAAKNRLYYMPESGLDLENAEVVVVRLRHLVEFEGSLEAPVKHIGLQGLILRHTARTFMATKEPLLRSDWTIYRGGAVLLTGTEGITILDCEFDQVGGNAVFVNEYNRGTVVRGCHIHGAGASGVCFVGDPGAVRNAKFEYRQRNTYEQIDKTPGPKTSNYPADCVVDDCLIHNMSVVEKQATGIQISMSRRITVRHCSIYDLGRAGINISEGTFGGHLIEFCDVFDTVRETGDHGSFNSWGRDRFWHLTDAPKEELPALSKLDTEKTIIRNSRWRCDHGWDVDLDDGSSHYEITNNLFLNRGLKLREGFFRKVTNNIAVNNSLHPHVWYHNSQDVVTGNIWMGPYRPAGGMPPKKWGKEVDGNLFTNKADRDKFRKHGCDANSIVGDPMFVDPANGDYRVKDGSPALKIGFRNFPMDRFGVKKASLKAIARTPVLPIPGKSQPRGRGKKVARQPVAIPMTSIWLGATLTDLEGEAFSAYGVDKEDGGVALAAVPKAAEAARSGLKANDVIQQLNGAAVSTVKALRKELAEAGAKPLQLKIVREQQAMALDIPKHAYLEIETADTAGGFSKLAVPGRRATKLSTNMTTRNDPLDTLVDGKLAKSYGPVFGNGVHNGAYKMDLGSVKPVTAITSWSFSQGNRGAQRLSVYGSASDKDPGWTTDKLTPIGTVDTVGKHGAVFTAASLRAAARGSLGAFRWIIWRVSPLNTLGGGENTAFQELHVECAP